MKEAHTSLAAI